MVALKLERRVDGVDLVAEYGEADGFWQAFGDGVAGLVDAEVQRMVVATLSDESSKEVLFALPDETVVYPGHGPKTTIGREKRTNPWLR